MVLILLVGLENFTNYINLSVNLIPFKTILNYIKVFDSLYSTRIVLLNLFGNLLALIPMAFFYQYYLKNKISLKILLLQLY